MSDVWPFVFYMLIFVFIFLYWFKLHAADAATFLCEVKLYFTKVASHGQVTLSNTNSQKSMPAFYPNLNTFFSLFIFYLSVNDHVRNSDCGTTKAADIKDFPNQGDTTMSRWSHAT